MPKALLMANPAASQFTGGIYRQVVSILKDRFDLRTSWPVSALETGRETRACADEGIDVVFAMGGDGVAHHVANGLVGTDTALGLIPAGTTNVLARILNIPRKPRAAAKVAAEYEALPTRMVRVVADTDFGEITRYAMFSLGVGFDADVVEVAETRPFSKSRFGSVHYASTAITRLVSGWRSEVPTLRVECDGDRFDAVVALTQVHDPYTYFGAVPLHLTPDTPKGVATLVANDLGVRRATEIFARAVLGRKHRDATGVKLWTDFEQLVIDADPKMPFQADGELLGMASGLEITPAESAMRILRPS